MHFNQRLPFATFLLTAIFAATPLVFGQGVAFQASSLPQQARIEGLSETMGAVVIQATGAGSIPGGSSITFLYSGTVTNMPTIASLSGSFAPVGTCSGAACPGANGSSATFAVSASGNQLTVTVSGTGSSGNYVKFASGDYLVISQVRVNVNALGSSASTVTATMSGTSSQPTMFPITFTQAVVPVASPVNPSLSLSRTAASNTILGCGVSAQSFSVTIAERYPAALTTLAQETAFTPNFLPANGSQVLVTLSNVPAGLAVTPGTPTIVQGQLSFGSTPAAQTSTNLNAPLVFVYTVTGGSTSISESSNFPFTIGMPAGSQSTSIPTIGLTASVNATVGIGPVQASSSAVAFGVNGISAGTVATVTDCAGVPSITSLSPSTASVGGSQFALTVNGTGFVSNSVVRWNTSPRTTTFISSSQLTAVIPGSDLASLGAAQVSVFNPAPGGGTSGNSVVPIVNPNPVPAITSLGTNSVLTGSNGLALDVIGTGFLSGATVQWNGSNRPTTFGGSTSLLAVISAADLAVGGTFPITVTNAPPTSGPSSPLNFTVNNPVPGLSSVSPSFGAGGGSGMTVSVLGSGFLNGASAFVNGSARTTIFGSSTSLGVVLTGVDLSLAGALSIKVLNPSPTTGFSNAAVFTVTGNNPLPAISNLSPATAPAGSGSFTLTVYGSNFVPGSTVWWNNSQRATTFLTSQQLTAAITSADVASASTFSVTVVSPGPGGGTSAAMNFAVGSSSQGAVAAQSVNGGATLTISVPLVLNLNSGAVIGALSVGLRVLPGAGAPPVAVNLNFQNDAALPASAPTIANTTSDIGLFWGSFNTPLTGTVTLGVLQVAIPQGAAVGQTYTIQISAASGAQNSAAVPLTQGPDATLTIQQSYLVGDVSPSTGDTLGQFGDGPINTLDLIEILRAVTNISVPVKCSDRYDAMDVFPVDSQTARGGGDGLNTLDLVQELRRALNIDAARPVRLSRNGSCSGVAPERREIPEREIEGTIEVEGSALYLRAHRDLNLAGLAMSMRLPDGVDSHYTPGVARVSVLDGDQPGLIAMAWLNGITMAAGDRLLLGYVDGADRGSIVGVSANESVGRAVRIVAAKAQ